MEKNIVLVKHHFCDYTCMWNGIEDLYMKQTKEQIPDWFFFCLSGVASHAYLKQKKDIVPIRLCVGDGRPRQVYPKIADQIGMQFKITDGVTKEYAFKKVKQEIDAGYPVILGPLDMYHLPYLKMYHKEHIPFHYIMMTGYDDEKECIYVFDCGREELQSVPYEDLNLAWNVEKGPVGDKNGFISIRFQENAPKVLEIASRVLPQKAKEQLNAKPSIIGLSALRRAAEEFPEWSNGLSKESYHAVLLQFVMGIATVPKYPNCLIPELEDKPDVPFQANCDKMAAMLYWLDDKYKVPAWSQAAEYFAKAGVQYDRIFHVICDYLKEKSTDLSCVPTCLNTIADLEEKGYQLLL